MAQLHRSGSHTTSRMGLTGTPGYFGELSGRFRGKDIDIAGQTAAQRALERQHHTSQALANMDASVRGSRESTIRGSVESLPSRCKNEG